MAYYLHTVLAITGIADVAQKAFLKMMENPKIMAMFKEMVNK